jgi:hypothetical protein
MSHLRLGGGPAASLIQIWENLGWIVQYNLVLNLCFFFPQMAGVIITYYTDDTPSNTSH